MHRFHRILIPTDFSLCAEAALRHGLFLAQQFQAEVHLLHVTAEVRKGEEEDGVNLPWPDRLTAPVADMPAYTTHWQDGLIKREVRIHPDPVTAILEYAREASVDMIVMGAHGDRGTGHLLSMGMGSAFLGQTAEQVIRHASCPVLRVGLRKGRSPELVHHILVPVDGSALSLRALSCADTLAELYDARMDILQVIPHNDLTRKNRHAWQTEERQGKARLARLYHDHGGHQEGVIFHVAQGIPAREIQSYAEQHAVEMIVMGAFDEGHEALGEVAEKTIHSSSSLVMVVRNGKLNEIHTENQPARVARLTPGGDPNPSP